MTLASDGDAGEIRMSRPFTPEQIAYLGSLPAVVGVGPNRIRYAMGFRRACLKRYMNGANPTDLFRKAGLDPAIVGFKRIERSFVRWRANADDILASHGEWDGRPDSDDEWFFPYGGPSENPGGGVDRWRLLHAHTDGTDGDDGGADDGSGTEPATDGTSAGKDAGDAGGGNPRRRAIWTKDEVIDQLIRYNAMLERENRELKRRLGIDADGQGKTTEMKETQDMTEGTNR